MILELIIGNLNNSKPEGVTSEGVTMNVNQISEFEILISFNPDKPILIKELILNVIFNNEIVLWKDHDYHWKRANKQYVSGANSPKSLQLKNDIYVSTSKNIGAWRMNPKNSQKLEWVFIHQNLTPIIQYGNMMERVEISEFWFSEPIEFKLFLTKTKPIEIARTPKGFISTLIFSDHCDYDTEILLEKQREFFKENNIKISKGFFKFFNSKRIDNASMEYQKEEYQKWEEDGHELCYHALSQSKRKINKNTLLDFENLEINLSRPIYIDHGYLNYNFTLASKSDSGTNVLSWIRKAKIKGIKTIWNYLDSIEGGINQINQLNPEDFYANKIDTGKEKIRKILFYHSNEEIIYHYNRFAVNIKKTMGGSYSSIIISLKSIIPIVKFLTKFYFNPKNFKMTNWYNRFCPSYFTFQASPDKKDIINVFQTVAIKNYDEVFCSSNLKKLVNEQGLVIGHTYFAFLESYHNGRVFLDANGTLNPKVKKVLNEISDLILANKIWNPTLSQYIDYTKKLNSLEVNYENGDFSIINCPEDVHFKVEKDLILEENIS